MKRNINLEEITDGRRYGLNDLVKADCGGCTGCSVCCHNMGQSIVLDPLDCYRLTQITNKTFEELLSDKIELNVVDGIILPNLKMDSKEEKCSFLNQEGRCTIHEYRPGICRIFPLGRIYEDDGFSYVLQTMECPKKNRTKVKVHTWIDTKNLKQNQKFINDWHYFLKEIQNVLDKKKEESYHKQINLYILNQFFIKTYEEGIDFYDQFYERLIKLKSGVISE